jgi:N4-(beta-N-acetylglucosaminyl)-L-asparaginase
VSAGASAALALTVGHSSQAQSPGPTTRKSAKPLVIASANGFTIKNGGELSCVETAFEKIVAGEDVLDSLIAGVNIVELDPEEDSVGFGGLPNAEGVVQLDSCCMHGPLKQAGGVAALEGVRTPSLVAKAVMSFSDHHLLVSQGAQDFARMMGFRIEDDLNSDHSRSMWLEWKRRIDPKHFPEPSQRLEAERQAGLSMIRDGLVREDSHYGTINCNGIGPAGEICGVTTTSGLSWKIPGRVGDSPIIGAGLYVDNTVGAAGSTGRGEANLFGLCSYLVVEEMRRGKHPKDAGIVALQRIKANTIEKRHLNSQGNPNFNVKFYVISKSGEYAGVSMYADADSSQFALCTENGAELVQLSPLLDRPASA